MTEVPKIEVLDIELKERNVILRLPFKFGVVTLTEAPQAFCRVRLQINGQESTGVSAELMVPKWFDKNESLSNDDNFDQLRTSLNLAKQAYLASKSDTAFGLMIHNYAPQTDIAKLAGLNPLTANFGTALIDRAVLDAICRAEEISFLEAIKSNICGIQATDELADLKAFGIDDFLGELMFHPTIHARHTVGMVDPLEANDQASKDRVDDGLPETLEEIIDVYGHRYFKIKVRGELEADLDRLMVIADILDRKVGNYKVTLDGNEQYKDIDGVCELMSAITAESSLRQFWAATLFIEQPIKRALALSVDVRKIAQFRPVIIDESDEALDTYLLARERGYHGVSTKNCKGFYKSIINAARCKIWNSEQQDIRYFMSAEDLTCQGGVSVQQDLALVSLLGLKHVERNGHHYVNGMAGADPEEQNRFLTAHAGLYRNVEGRTCLNIDGGVLDIASLDCIGMATAVLPNFENMNTMKVPTPI